MVFSSLVTSIICWKRIKRRAFTAEQSHVLRDDNFRERFTGSAELIFVNSYGLMRIVSWLQILESYQGV